ncbi:MAG: hypothetical protein HY286_13150 [Planctomycetes bacterium]|nr:hypothetical protein [Planctomycetota bacterium]
MARLKPRVFIARAPLRVDFAGGFTDVPPFCEKDTGFVVNAAIELYAHARVRLLRPGMPSKVKLRIEANHYESAAIDGVAAPPPPPALEPFMVALGRSGAGPAEVYITSEGPPASGLGTSGSALVALLAALDAAIGRARPPIELAREARAIEVDQLQRIGGGQDPIAAALGGILAIEFVSRDGNPMKLHVSRNLKETIGRNLLLIDLRKPRSSSARIGRVVENLRARDRKTGMLLRAMAWWAREAAGALRAGNYYQFVESIAFHSMSLEKLEPSIYSNGVRQAVLDARADGGTYCAAKPCGAGGGGCVAVLARDRPVDELRRDLKRRGYHVFTTRIADRGVEVVQPKTPRRR